MTVLLKGKYRWANDYCAFELISGVHYLKKKQFPLALQIYFKSSILMKILVVRL